MRLELPHVLHRPGDAMTSVSLCHTRCSRRVGLGGCHDRPRKLKKSPHLMRSSAELPGASRVITSRRLYHDDSPQLQCQLSSYRKAHSGPKAALSRARIAGPYVAPATSRSARRAARTSRPPVRP